MKWGKVPKVKDDDERNRCSQLVMRDHNLVKCVRLARGCRVSKNGHILNECMMLCGGHQRHMVKHGFTITILDLRRSRKEAA